MRKIHGSLASGARRVLKTALEDAMKGVVQPRRASAARSRPLRGSRKGLFGEGPAARSRHGGRGTRVLCPLPGSQLALSGSTLPARTAGVRTAGPTFVQRPRGGYDVRAGARAHEGDPRPGDRRRWVRERREPERPAGAPCGHDQHRRLQGPQADVREGVAERRARRSARRSVGGGVADVDAEGELRLRHGLPSWPRRGHRGAHGEGARVQPVPDGRPARGSSTGSRSRSPRGLATARAGALSSRWRRELRRGRPARRGRREAFASTQIDASGAPERRNEGAESDTVVCVLRRGGVAATTKDFSARVQPRFGQFYKTRRRSSADPTMLPG